MDRRLRRAPDAEWVLMYRLGLSRKRIADLVRVHPAAVGYHLVIARRQDPGLEAEHQAAAGAEPAGPSPTDLARMEEVIAWVSAEGRLPRWPFRATGANGRWRGGCPSAGAKQPKAPLTRPTATVLPGCRGGPRTTGQLADEASWHDRLAELVDFRQEGNDWPRHHDYDSEREHTLGVWIHAQRYKRRRGELDPVKVKLLDDAVPGWQTGRTRGRPPRR